MSDFFKLFQSVFLRPYNDLTEYFTVAIDLQRMTAGIPGDITLNQGPREGTPIEKSTDPAANQVKLQLKTPILSYKDGQIKGKGKLLIGGSVPESFKDPMEIDVDLLGLDVSVSNTPLLIQGQGHQGNFSYGLKAQGRVLPEVQIHGTAKLSILTTDWRLQLHYDNRQLSNAIEKIITNSGKNGTFSDLGNQLRYPGFDLSAAVRISLPVIGQTAISKISFNAPTTQPLSKPLPGAAFPIPYHYEASRILPTPPGTLFDIWAVGLGYSQSDFNAARGSSFNCVGVPIIAPNKLSVNVFIQYYRVHRISEGLDLGFRLTVSPDSNDLAQILGSSKQEESALMEFRAKAKEFEENARLKTMASFEILGYF